MWKHWMEVHKKNKSKKEQNVKNPFMNGKRCWKVVDEYERWMHAQMWEIKMDTWKFKQNVSLRCERINI